METLCDILASKNEQNEQNEQKKNTAVKIVIKNTHQEMDYGSIPKNVTLEKKLNLLLKKMKHLIKK